MITVLSAILGVTSSCGGPRAPVRPVALVGTVKHYAPLAMAVDAAAPGQAVMLGSDDRDGSTVLVLPTAPPAVVVDAMIGWAPVTRVAIIATSAPAVAAATAPGPSGTRWPAELVRARQVATELLGKQLTEVSLTAVPAGSAEHATVAPLLAGAFLAALTGERIDPAATLLGALDPDGAIAPIAGLPEQVLGAITLGKTRIGIPRGMRRARSQAGADVDVVALARAHDAEAIEVADVHAAYELLTRRQLPAQVPVAEPALALDATERAGLEATYRAWQARLAGEWAALLQLEQAGRVPEVIARLVREAHVRGERAERRRRAGQLAAAVADLRAAWISASAANTTSGLAGKVAAGDVDAAVTAMIALDPAAQVRAVFDAVGARRPTTIGGHLAMLDGLQAALRGWAYREAAADAVRAAADLFGAFRGKPTIELAAPATREAVADAAAPAVHAMLRAAAELAVAEQALGPAGGESGVTYACQPSSLLRAATALATAATTQLRDAEAGTLAPAARRDAISESEARRRHAARAPGYGVADRLSRPAPDSLPGALATAWGSDAVATGLLQLAAATIVQHEAARLRAWQEPRGATVPDASTPGTAAEASSAPGLGSTLPGRIAGAQRAARARARAARIATGAIPLQAKLAYQLAAATAASGAIEDQLDVLTALWASTASSQAALLLVRN